MTTLAQRLVIVHRCLEAAGIPHAFGGAIALAYCVDEPRGTRDLDVNVFVEPSEADRVVAALPDGVACTDDDRALLARDGQVRLWWDETPVDLFFDVHDFHRTVAGRVRTVPFADTQVPVLDCVSLTVFKAFFNRGKDWVDIEAMVEAGALDGPTALDWVARLLGDDHPSCQRLAALVQSEA